ncbi:MAG: transposase [Pseudomonadota bacterium]
MAWYLRPQVTGATVFFTVCLADRGSDLLVREVDLLRRAVAATKRERPFEIEAWVVLPDHLHSIWQLPAGDRDFATRWRVIKGRFSRELPFGARRASHVARAERGIWQRRFWERHLRGEADFQAHLRYCWQSPVRLGLCASPEAWPYSSARRDRRCAGADR